MRTLVNDYIAKVESIPGWETDEFLKHIHKQLQKDCFLNDTQRKAIERYIEHLAEQTQVNPQEREQARTQCFIDRIRKGIKAAQHAGEHEDVKFLCSVEQQLVMKGYTSKAQERKANAILDCYHS